MCECISNDYTIEYDTDSEHQSLKIIISNYLKSVKLKCFIKKTPESHVLSMSDKRTI
jgi:hypothetical protein